MCGSMADMPLVLLFWHACVAFLWPACILWLLSARELSFSPVALSLCVANGALAQRRPTASQCPAAQFHIHTCESINWSTCSQEIADEKKFRIWQNKISCRKQKSKIYQENSYVGFADIGLQGAPTKFPLTILSSLTNNSSTVQDNFMFFL